MFKNFLQKQKYHTDIKWSLLFSALLFNSTFTADDKRLNLFSMSFGDYYANYKGNFSYAVESESESIPFDNKADFDTSLLLGSQLK